MLAQFAAVGIGAALGGWLRWGLGHWLNPVFPTLPLGTLAANLGGGLAMGVVMELATRHAIMSPEARLFVATGFLGGLTTFSTFSAESATLFVRGEWIWGGVLVASHVAGSIALTLAGLWLARVAFAGIAS